MGIPILLAILLFIVIALLDAMFLGVTQVSLIIAGGINAFRYFIHGTFLDAILTTMFQAIGFSNVPGGSLFVLVLFIAISLYGLSYIFSIFLPSSSRWVNIKNVIVNTSLAVLLIGSSFGILKDVESLRIHLGESLSASVLGLVNENLNSENGVNADFSIRGFIVPVCRDASLSERYPAEQETNNPTCARFGYDSNGNPSDVDGAGCTTNRGIGCGFTSLADYTGALVGISSKDQLKKFPPEAFKNDFFEAYTSQLRLTMGMGDFTGLANDKLFPSLVTAFAGALMGLIALLEGVSYLILDLSAIVLFACIPIGVLMSFFGRTQGYWVSILDRYIQVLVATIILSTLIPIFMYVAYSIAGFAGLIVIGGIFWLAAVSMVYRPFTSILDFTINGAFTSVGLMGVTDAYTESARGVARTVSTAASVGAAIATGGASAALLGTAAIAGGLGKMAEETVKGAQSPFSASKSMEVAAKLKDISEKAGKAAAFMGGAALGKSKAGRMVTALSAITSSRPDDLTLGESIKYSGWQDMLLTGASVRAPGGGGLTSLLMTSNRLKQNAMGRLQREAALGNPEAVEDFNMVKERASIPGGDKRPSNLLEGRFNRPQNKIVNELRGQVSPDTPLLDNNKLANGVEIAGNENKLRVVNSEEVAKLGKTYVDASAEEKKTIKANLQQVLGEEKTNAILNLGTRTVRDSSNAVNVVMDAIQTSVGSIDISNPENRTMLKSMGALVVNGKPKLNDKTADALRSQITKIIQAQGGALDVSNPEELMKVVQQAQANLFGGRVSEANMEKINNFVQSSLVDAQQAGKLSAPVNNALEINQQVFREALRRQLSAVGPEKLLETFTDANGNFTGSPLYQTINAVLKERGLGYLMADSQVRQQMVDAWEAMTQVQVNLSGLDILYTVADARKVGENPSVAIKRNFNLTNNSLRGDFANLISMYAQNPDQDIAGIVNVISELDPKSRQSLREFTLKLQRTINEGQIAGNPAVQAFVSKKGNYILAATELFNTMRQNGLSEEEAEVFNRIVSESAKVMGYSKSSGGTVLHHTIEFLRTTPMNIPVMALPSRPKEEQEGESE